MRVWHLSVVLRCDDALLYWGGLSFKKSASTVFSNLQEVCVEFCVFFKQCVDDQTTTQQRYDDGVKGTNRWIRNLQGKLIGIYA